MRGFCILLCSYVLCLGSMHGQSAGSNHPATPQPAQATDNFERVGAAVKISMLGIGVEGAARVTRNTNVRAGFNALGYSRGFNKDGVDYSGHLEFRTFEAHFDVFPWAKSFHVSPGLVAYAGTPVTASAVVPGNQSFTLNSVQYYSDPTNLATANGKISFNSVAPTVTAGWGNLVHRNHKHISIPFEVGVVFQGSPKSALAIGGNVCTSPGVNCGSAANNPALQQNIVGEQNKINNSLTVFKYYPILSGGFGYTF